MQAEIRYAVNGKTYKEEIIDIVLYDNNGNKTAYIYSEEDSGFCIMDFHKGQQPLK